MADEEVMNDEVQEEAAQEAEPSLVNEEVSSEEENKEGANSDDTSKADGDEKADESSKDEEKDEESGAPESYEDFKVPEGFEALDQEALNEFVPVAKELDLGQAEAQKVVDLHAKMVKTMAEKQAEQWQDTLKSWREESTNDSEIGGAKFQENVGDAKRALDVFGNEKLKAVLDTSGIGNNVEVIRMLSKIGKAIKDDAMVFGKDVGNAPKSHEQVLYPDMN